ncbi:hypothetical protein Tco_1228574 [Tanacetum coccineum]
MFERRKSDIDYNIIRCRYPWRATRAIKIDKGVFGQRSDGEEHKEDHVYRIVMEHWGVACALDQLKQNATKGEILLFGRTVFQDTFRKMYALSSYVEALTPMPEDGGHWSALHSWVMATPSFLEFMMFFWSPLQGVWFRSCALWSVVQGLWFKGVGEKTWLRGRPFKFEKQWSWL